MCLESSKCLIGWRVETGCLIGERRGTVGTGGVPGVTGGWVAVLRVFHTCTLTLALAVTEKTMSSSGRNGALRRPPTTGIMNSYSYERYYNL